MALFIRRFNKGLRKQGYKVNRRKFPNKKKRTSYNCGSTEHFIAKCLYEIKENKYKKDKKESKHEHKRSHRDMGEAHIGHEWDSTNEASSEDDEKIITVAIQSSSSTPKLFNNLTDDEGSSTIHCLMAKGQKVKPKPKSPSPSSDSSDIDSSDESSDEEIDNLLSKMDKKN